ncbi:O-antigen ligase family protein [Patescibacteria group bacterium]
MQKYLKISEKLIYWLVIATLMFIPLYMKFPAVRIPDTFVSIRLEDILIAFLTFVWVVDIIIRKKVKEILSDHLNQAIFLFIFIGAVATFSGIFLTHTSAPFLGILHLMRRIEYMILLPIVIYSIRERRQGYVYLALLSIILFFVNVYALGQRYLRFPAISTTTSELSKGLVYYLNQYDRVSSTFAGHYDLAIFLMMGIILVASVLFFFLGKRNKLSFKDKNIPVLIWLTVLAGLSSLVLVMTAARLSFVALFVGVTFALIILKKKKYLLLMALLSAIILIYPSNLRNRLVSTFTVNVLQQYSEYEATNEIQEKRSKLNIPTLPVSRKRIIDSNVDAADITPGEPINTVDLGVYRSFSIRTQVEWPRAVRSLKKNPFLGTGYSSLGLATDSDLLRSLGEVGLLGTIAFVFVMIEIIRRMWRLFKVQQGFIRYLGAGILSVIVAFLVNALFIDVFEASKVAIIFWMLIGIYFGVSKVGSTKRLYEKISK